MKSGILRHGIFFIREGLTLNTVGTLGSPLLSIIMWAIIIRLK